VVWVDVCGWQEFGSPVYTHAYGPATVVVDDPVVVPAQRDTVVPICWAAVLPGDDVVDLGPPWWPVAAGERAATVAEQDRVPGGAGVEPPAPAQVDRHTLPVECGG
jgi:hypothetical protein